MWSRRGRSHAGLAPAEELVFEAGRHDESVRVRTGDLFAATYAIVADICLD